MENQLVPYGETKIGSDINQNEIKILTNGAIVIRNTDTEIQDKNKALKEIKDEVKLLREKRKIAETALIPIMVKSDIETLNVNNGKIEYSETVRKLPLNKKNLQKILISFFTNDENFNNLLNLEYVNNIDLAQKRTDIILKYIEEKNQTKKTVTLKGTFN